MIMPVFLCKLIPPRTTFAQDMTEAEAKLMQEHVAYWRGLADKEIAVVFGPVADPRGAWGVGIVETENEAEVQVFRRDDPTIKANLGFEFEIYPMSRAVFRK